MHGDRLTFSGPFINRLNTSVLILELASGSYLLILLETHLEYRKAHAYPSIRVGMQIS